MLRSNKAKEESRPWQQEAIRRGMRMKLERKVQQARYKLARLEAQLAETITSDKTALNGPNA